MRTPKRSRAAAKAKPGLQVVLAASRYGTPMPSIEYQAKAGDPIRGVRAVLHQIAAEVELASIPTDHRWLVQIEQTRDDYSGTVYLELISGFRLEAEAGMQILRAVAAKRGMEILRAVAKHG